MCLKNEDLHMQYNPSKRKYVGKAYKHMRSYDGKGCRVRGGVILKIGKWYDALKVQNEGSSEDNQQLKKISTENYSDPLYAAGFHLFLSSRHAAKWGGTTSNVYEVEYCDVIGYGKNNFSLNSSGPCVIAHQMRIVRRLNKSEIQ